jgi:hypothetical protein
MVKDVLKDEVVKENLKNEEVLKENTTKKN